ncbi:unnamed protein product [Nippostrongylus brasiliensis]|uniref:MuDRA-like transposase n=1 Tax=Nippostrongylus brasiliensis TaxID=27835 RepID=A0A0N4Y9H9_NIPBR|nr:unnamed protein product [Nippostrongylus brasiliensis]
MENKVVRTETVKGWEPHRDWNMWHKFEKEHREFPVIYGVKWQQKRLRIDTLSLVPLNGSNRVPSLVIADYVGGHAVPYADVDQRNKRSKS